MKIMGTLVDLLDASDVTAVRISCSLQEAWGIIKHTRVKRLLRQQVRRGVWLAGE